MITRISLRNFGPFDDSGYTLNLKPETFIVGPNNIGKSTFLAAYAVVALHGFRSDITKFVNSDEATYGHKKDSGFELTVDGNYSGVDVSRTFNSKIPNAIKQNPKTHPQIEAMKRLSETFQNTWYLSSARAFFPPREQINPSPNPTIYPEGTNIVRFLLERYTSRDPNWDEAERWLKKIDPAIALLSAPLRGIQASVETERTYGKEQFPINVSLQGGGIQRAVQIVSSVVFSPKNSLIIIEEPEMNLHRETMGILFDLFNKAVNEWGKQIIITTHSIDMLLLAYSDVGMKGSRRGGDHIQADAEKFGLVTFQNKGGKVSIEDYDVKNKTFKQFQEDYRLTLGSA